MLKPRESLIGRAGDLVFHTGASYNMAGSTTITTTREKNGKFRKLHSLRTY